jgi:hypothetical protein
MYPDSPTLDFTKSMVFFFGPEGASAQYCKIARKSKK